MLFVCTWLWGTKWPPVYVERLAAGLRRNLKQPCRFVLVTDRSVSPAIVDIVVRIESSEQQIMRRPGCLVRMRMFDAGWQVRLGAVKGDRIACVDVDAVVTGQVDP